MKDNQDLEGWQLNIIGIIEGWDEFAPAARAAMDHGEDGVIFAMEQAARYGARVALEELVAEAVKRYGLKN